MSPASFKKNFEHPPLQYRTPSPPWSAFEPISPIGIGNTSADWEAPWRNDFKGQNGIKRPLDAEPHLTRGYYLQQRDSHGAMETFASIALATDRSREAALLPVSPPSESLLTRQYQDTERASKRARSEKLHSSEWTPTEETRRTRPVTSYDQLSDSRTFEAELLLNFSQAARFSSLSWRANERSNLDRSSDPFRSPGVASMLRPNTKLACGAEWAADLDTVIPAKVSAHRNEAFQRSRDENTLQFPSASCQNTNIQILKPIQVENSSEKIITEPCPPHSQRLEDESIQELNINSIHLPKDILRLNCMEDPPNVSLPRGFTDETDRRFGPDSVVEEHEAMSSEDMKEPQQQRGQFNDSKREAADVQTFIGTREQILKQSITFKEISIPHEDAKLVSTVPDAAGVAASTARQATLPAVCSACHFTRNSTHVDYDNSSTSWISCDGCKAWFHFACAGFKSEREVRSVDKYRCRNCRPLHGSTTYVRKSSRAHSAIDYAGLNEGVLKTSDERPEHHYIKPIKEGIIKFLPETFARMRPELVTAEYFEKGNGMKEPIVIPAHLNPRPTFPGAETNAHENQDEPFDQLLQNASMVDDWLSHGSEFQRVSDHGQDALDMVMPQNLTVRKVADLYGLEEKVEVIDVKSQNGESKKWNMRRWADYYESSNNKAVRNVISLEVSRSRLGRLIRRPQIVRDMDLQDSVWPQELQARGEFPRVQLYCLMSVADCFTDFHIDFGGSSVFYHILKGKKTFLFIPPKEKHLKKYEEWCMSPAQNWTFLADQTKECYRVDLSEGDTMLIPAGWIHAVWTPEDSLVIGGNFLTRMHYGMQIRVAQIEKATGVARKFRYPQFQKLHWYTALKYLENDPLPSSVKELLQRGGFFHRERPAHYGFDEWGENSISGMENYHFRYYAQAELEGFPDLIRYLLRTALIDLGIIVEGITAETRNAVKKAIPRGYGEPFDILKNFAMWCAWKRGNEPIPQWAYPHAAPEGLASDSAGKMSAAALKKLDQDIALQAPRRQSARRQSRLQTSRKGSAVDPSNGLGRTIESKKHDSTSPVDLLNPTPTNPRTTPSTKTLIETITQEEVDVPSSGASEKQGKNARTALVSHRKPACESCRKRRRACNHRESIDCIITNAKALASPGGTTSEFPTLESNDASNNDCNQATVIKQNVDGQIPDNDEEQRHPEGHISQGLRQQSQDLSSSGAEFISNHEQREQLFGAGIRLLDSNDARTPTIIGASSPALVSDLESKARTAQNKEYHAVSGNSLHNSGRTKACNECRKSKVSISS